MNSCGESEIFMYVCMYICMLPFEIRLGHTLPPLSSSVRILFHVSPLFIEIATERFPRPPVPDFKLWL